MLLNYVSTDGFGLAVDKAGFGAGACTTFIDPRSGLGGAELDNACASDDSTGFPDVLKNSSARFSNSSNPRFPNMAIASLGMLTTSTHDRLFSCTSTGAARAKSIMERMRRIPETMLYRRIFVGCIIYTDQTMLRVE